LKKTLSKHAFYSKISKIKGEMREIMIKDNYQKMYNTIEKLSSWQYIDTLKLKVSDIERFCQNLELDVERKANNEKIEIQSQIPIMATHFYYYLYEYKHIPTQKEFISFYIRANEAWIRKNVPTNELKKALLGRLSRTYPSLLRDIHFYHVLKESEKFDNVLYNLRYDLFGKVDIFVQQHGVAYGLQLRTKTANSNKYYIKKPNRHAIPAKSVLLDLPIDLSQAKSIKTKKNWLKVYDVRKVHEVLSLIQQHQEKVMSVS